LIDECVFYHDEVIFVVYVDDGIFLGIDDCNLTNVIKEIKETGLDIEDQGHPADYAGVTITSSLRGHSLNITSMMSTLAMLTLSLFWQNINATTCIQGLTQIL
jgi:hypothetical protein